MCVLHISTTSAQSMFVQSSTWTRRFSTMKRFVSAQWQTGGGWGGSWSTLCSSSGCVCLWSDCFTSHITGASVSLASLRDPGCPSHCGAFSLEGAQLCCSVSTRGSACTRPWAALAGGNLGTKHTCYQLAEGNTHTGKSPCTPATFSRAWTLKHCCF